MDWLGAFFAEYGQLLMEGTWDSILMTAISCAFAYVLGIPLGVCVLITAEGNLRPNRVIHSILGWIINVGRSIPFIILLFAIIPFTRIVVGTSLGVAGATVPLVVCATPFVARMVEQSLAEVDPSLIEAGESFGASAWQLIYKVYLKESLPSLVRGVSITFITLFGFVAMAGCVGAGGLGDIAIRYGYQRYQTDVMIAAVILCVILVELVQSLGNAVSKLVDKRTRN